MDRFSERLRAAEAGGNLHDVAMGGNRRHFQNVGEGKLRRAMVGIYFQEFVQDGLGLGAILVEKVFLVLAQPVGPLPAGAQGGIIGHMAEKVEGIGLGLAGGFGQFLKVDAPFRPRIL